MAVESETVLNKMMGELQKAMDEKASKRREHVHAVRLMCDLLLEEQDSLPSTDEEELKKMMGTFDQSSNKTEKSTRTRSTIDHEDANGSSIFDF